MHEIHFFVFLLIFYINARKQSYYLEKYTNHWQQPRHFHGGSHLVSQSSALFQESERSRIASEWGALLASDRAVERRKCPYVNPFLTSLSTVVGSPKTVFEIY